ncbi:hypothetical protein [Cerasicoccus arenae]|uniref:Uncharacterized protein n=1 Tax=Cerasicoccus arenae TaxID=424488 RepID=A0A8J3DAX7_9BACT|nr:hypothetical protein [Cerasicoccus arenae]MBK1860002.1 hypothetical protein [Cerasicoccus arenae]GHB97030.1 hypothetical protein GCM10007047_11260 [Cerasicoccus arenae]
MELKQKKGKLFDLLSIEGDRILHKWHLTKESGESFAPISNIDPEFGKVVQKTEGRLPYLLLSLLPLFFLLFLPSLEAPEGSQ